MGQSEVLYGRKNRIKREMSRKQGKLEKIIDN
jgi:hypothetical protein